MRRPIVIGIALMLVVAGCAHAPGPKPSAPVARIDADRAVRRLVVSWSTTLAGSPGGIATDRSGAVVAVDDDTVVALDEGGRERWSAPVPGAGLGWPLIVEGLVVVPTLRDTSGPGGCVALGRENGARVWAYEEPDSQGVAVASASDVVVCALANGVIVAVDRTNGTRRWRVVLGSGAARSGASVSERTALAVDEATGTVAIAAHADSRWEVATLDLRTGADRGVFDFRGLGPVSAPVSTAPGVLAVGVSGSQEVCALDLRLERVGRCVAVPVPNGFDPAGIPLVADGVVVIAGRDGSVTAVDLAVSRVRWSTRGPNPILDARPVVVGGVVMFLDWTRVPWGVRLVDGSAVDLPKFDGWVVAVASDPGGGFEVAKRNMDGGWIERWLPAS
jgi:outer membrane protein assembly factor BamB